MSNDRWKKVNSESAREIVEPGLLEPESAALLDDQIRPEALIGALVEAGNLADAVKVMTRALPAREAVWWACVCARQLSGIEENKVEAEALKVAETWVYEPSDEHRELAFNFIKENDSNGAGSMCAMAAAFSAGDAPLGKGQNLALDPAVFPQIVGGVVMVSASGKQGEEIKDWLRTCLLRGEDIAQGGNGKIDGGEG